MESSSAYKKIQRPWFDRTFSKLTPGCVRGSIITLFSTILGAGQLSIPFALSQTGLVLGCLLLLVCPMCFFLFYMILAEMADQENQYYYSKLAQKLLGLPGKLMAEISVMVNCLGTVAAYMVLAPQIMVSILVSFGILDDPEDNNWRIYITLIMSVAVWFPLCLPQRITTLAYFSFLSVIAILYITVLVAVQTPDQISYIDQPEEKIQYFNFEVNVIRSIGVIIFSYDGFQNVPSIYRELQFRSRRRLGKVALRSYLFLVVLMLILGITGYLSTLNQVPDSIVFREPADGTQKEYDWPMVVARITVVVFLTICIALQLFPARLAASAFIFGTQNLGLVWHVMLTACLIGAMTIVAILVPDVIILYNLLGGIVITIMAFFCPMLMYWKSPNSLVKKIMVTILAGHLVFLGMLCGGYEIYLLF